jgi:hypothetical protein
MDGKCPAEVYQERESACRVMLGLFESQEDCARFHHCPVRECAIDGRWSKPGKRSRHCTNKVMAQFIGVAFDGPKPPDDPASSGCS